MPSHSIDSQVSYPYSLWCHATSAERALVAKCNTGRRVFKELVVMVCFVLAVE